MKAVQFERVTPGLNEEKLAPNPHLWRIWSRGRGGQPWRLLSFFQLNTLKIQIWNEAIKLKTGVAWFEAAFLCFCLWKLNKTQTKNFSQDSEKSQGSESEAQWLWPLPAPYNSTHFKKDFGWWTDTTRILKVWIFGPASRGFLATRPLTPRTLHPSLQLHRTSCGSHTSAHQWDSAHVSYCYYCFLKEPCYSILRGGK